MITRTVLIAVLAILLIIPSCLGMASQNYTAEVTETQAAGDMSSQNFSMGIEAEDSGYVVLELESDEEEPPAPPPPDDDPDGPGGGTVIGGGGVPSPNFELLPDEIVERLLPEEARVIELIISNTGTASLNVSLSAMGEIIPIVSFSKDSFVLQGGNSTEILMSIDGSSAPGTAFVGNIRATANDVSKEIPVTIIVIAEERDALFDLRVVIEKDVFSPSEDVSAHITMINMGNLRPVDVEIMYELLKDGVVVDSGIDTLAVETQASIIRSLRIGEGLTKGEYVFSVDLTYGNETVSSSDSFIVREDEDTYEWDLWILIWLIVISAIVLVTLVYVYTKKHTVIIHTEPKRDLTEEKKVADSIKTSWGLAAEKDATESIKAAWSPAAEKKIDEDVKTSEQKKRDRARKDQAQQNQES